MLAPTARISVDAEHMSDPHAKLAVIGRLYRELESALKTAGIDTTLIPPSDYDTHMHCPEGTDKLYRCLLEFNPKGPVELLHGPRDGDLTAVPEGLDTMRIPAVRGKASIHENPESGISLYRRWAINKDTRRWVFVYVN